MHKIRISVQYKYLNDEFGTFPYIHIGYINDSNEELTANDIISKKISSARVPNTGYFYGTTVDGEEFKAGKYKVLLASYSLVAEGLDVPMLENIIMASPVKDMRLVIQAIGRCQRPYKDKKIANVYDLVDNVSMLEKFFTKRKSVYKKEGWKIV